MRRLSSLLLSTLALAATAHGQPAITVNFDVLSNRVAPIPNAPYSGISVGKDVHTMPNGNQVTQDMPSVKEFRDSQGRTRTEQTLGPSANAPVLVQIVDPLAGYWYVLEPAKKIAHRKPSPPPMSEAEGMKLAATVLGGTRLATAPGHLTSPQRIYAPLGQKTIDGVNVEGRRVTTIYPIGPGNDRPVTGVEEEWISPELLLLVQTTGNDPRSGASSSKYLNLTRAVPDAALFRVPDGYTIVDETGRYSIAFQ